MKSEKLKVKSYLGFTLVELLIVISLLGAIALIVIAAINPLEQANRARDTRFKGDSAQLIAATDRYFASKSQFPWVTTNTLYTNDSSFGFVSAGARDVGICGTTCSADGELLTALELKSEFRNRDFVNATTADKQLFIGKAGQASSSVYACFVPLSKSIRDKACSESKVYTLNPDGTRTPVLTSTCSGANFWTSSVAPGYICVPE